MITAVLHHKPKVQHKYVTTLLGVWGEFLLQDLVATSNSKNEHCCQKNSYTHPECYSQLANDKCKEYMRSMPALSQECQFSKYIIITYSTLSVLL